MISIEGTDLENILRRLFQQDIQIYIGDKIWKTGKFLLFKQNIYHIELYIQTKKTEKIEIPIPFDIIIKNQNNIYFSYKLKHILLNEEELESISKKYDSKSKFYDTYIEVRVI